MGVASTARSIEMACGLLSSMPISTSRLQNMGEDADPSTICAAQSCIRRSSAVIGFAFGGVNNQRLNFIAAAAQFAAGRETRAAQAGHAKLMNTLDKRFARAV
jgi:hypothetical protein